MSEGKEVWLARDDGEFSKMYNIVTGKRKPKKDALGIYEGVYALCTSKFERITGYKLSPGECRRVRIKIEEVK